MSYRKLSLWGFLYLAIAFIQSSLARALDRAVELVFSALPWQAPAFAIDGWSDYSNPMVTDAPPLHSLRHEAGTSRRAAARHT